MSRLSQLMALLRNTIMSIAKHYITGESLPEEVCSKLISARTFRAGSEILRQLRFAGVDLELYSKYVPGGTESIYDNDQRVDKRTHVIPLLPEDRFLCCVSHIFAEKYAAGYFSYYWAEVLSAEHLRRLDLRMRRQSKQWVSSFVIPCLLMAEESHPSRFSLNSEGVNHHQMQCLDTMA